MHVSEKAKVAHSSNQIYLRVYLIEITGIGVATTYVEPDTATVGNSDIAETLVIGTVLAGPGRGIDPKTPKSGDIKVFEPKIV